MRKTTKDLMNEMLTEDEQNEIEEFVQKEVARITLLSKRKYPVTSCEKQC